ncbi:hypothetical protein [Celeribacter sp.]|uniref:hypothetical protein n=1 Tax=Celeribacter sp. TaxID=1890673 RepID=UPI003A922FB3
MTYLRALLAILATVTLVACSDTKAITSETPLVDLGDFAFGHNVVVTTGMEKGPFSRDASEEEVETVLKAAIGERLNRYDGDRLYHLGVKVEAYALAMPGVPLIFTPKSALILSVTAWDDAAQKKLNEKPRLITVYEGLSGETLVGSGLTRTKEQQLEILSRNAAERIETWLQSNGEWFGVENAPEGPSEAEDAAAALEVLAPDVDPAALESASEDN